MTNLVYAAISTVFEPQRSNLYTNSGSKPTFHQKKNFLEKSKNDRFFRKSPIFLKLRKKCVFHRNEGLETVSNTSHPPKVTQYTLYQSCSDRNLQLAAASTHYSFLTSTILKFYVSRKQPQFRIQRFQYPKSARNGPDLDIFTRKDEIKNEIFGFSNWSFWTILEPKTAFFKHNFGSRDFNTQKGPKIGQLWIFSSQRVKSKRNFLFLPICHFGPFYSPKRLLKCFSLILSILAAILGQFWALFPFWWWGYCFLQWVSTITSLRTLLLVNNIAKFALF